jgi:drug/metabolite transporter (DMT)-like permease
VTHIGELAALGTSLGFTLGPTFFALAGRRVGSQVVNRSRLLLAAPLLALLHLLLLGRLLPTAEPAAWLWLAASGIVGLVLGDACLFRAFVLVGPRVTMLIYSSYPLISTLLALLFFGEKLRPLQLLAMAITLAGLAWVLTDGGRGQIPGRRSYGRGLLLAAAGALGQALGLILARQGMAEGFPTLSAHLIRMVSAAGGIWLLALVQGEALGSLRAMREDRRALSQVTGGTLFGPILGVWLSLIAIVHAEMGPASTLMALPPIFMLPVGKLIFGDAIGPRAIAGTLLAVAGALALVLA